MRKALEDVEENWTKQREFPAESQSKLRALEKIQKGPCRRARETRQREEDMRWRTRELCGEAHEPWKELEHEADIN